MDKVIKSVLMLILCNDFIPMTYNDIYIPEERMEEVNVFKYLGTVLCKH